jgi:acyl-CoA synthetase (AMP-forming)/AMP-acid ligase II
VGNLAEVVDRVRPGRNGRMVATLLPNGMDGLVVNLSCQVARAPVVTVNIRLSDPEIVHILTDSGATMLLAEGPLVEVAHRVAALADHEIEVVDVDEVPRSSSVPDITHDPEVGALPAGIFYTSGTTGLPKGSVMTNDTWLLNAMRWGWQLRIGQDDTMLVPGPLFHMSYSTFALATWMIGGTVRIMPTFDAATAYDEFAEVSTSAFLVPAMTGMLAEEWERRGRTPMLAMRRMMTAGAAVSAELLALAFEMFPNAQVSETYGWTEGGFASFEIKTPENIWDATVGRPTVGCQIKVVDDEGVPVPAGERGEIYLRTLACGDGYLNLPEASRAAWDGDFLKSGDIGVLDETGRLRIVDRKHGLIISGGENIYAAEVERALLHHEDLAEVAVFGRPDPKWGDVVVAVAVPRPGRSVTPDEVQQFARGRLADYKVPRRVHIWDSELPKNSMGKLQRFLVEKSVDELEAAQ